MRFTKPRFVILLISLLAISIIVSATIKRTSPLGNHKPTAEPIPRKEAVPESNVVTSQLEATVTTVNEDLAGLEDLIETDIDNLIDMSWNSRKIDSDFTSLEKVAAAVKSIPIQHKIAVSEPQLNLLRSSLTKMIFDNGNNNFDGYLHFLKESGETVNEYIRRALQKHLIEENGLAEEEIAGDPWQLLSQFWTENKCSSRWKGLVLEGSEISIFETRTRDLPRPKTNPHTIRRGTVSFNRLTNFPLTVDEALESEGSVLLADATIFIAHKDEMGGIVRPYVIRYWFDHINNQWRPLALSHFKNPTQRYRVHMVY